MAYKIDFFCKIASAFSIIMSETYLVIKMHNNGGLLFGDGKS